MYLYMIAGVVRLLTRAPSLFSGKDLMGMINSGTQALKEGFPHALFSVRDYFRRHRPVFIRTTRQICLEG